MTVIQYQPHTGSSSKDYGMGAVLREMERCFKLSSETPAEFLIVFARFEYALKHSGYLRSADGKAEADWDRFAVDLRDADVAEVMRAGAYILNHPPKKEVVVSGTLTWAEAGGQEVASDIERLVVFVRRIRNNLFHGGKFPYDQPYEYARDTQLVQGGIDTLLAVLELDGCEPLRRLFWDGQEPVLT